MHLYADVNVRGLGFWYFIEELIFAHMVLGYYNDDCDMNK